MYKPKWPMNAVSIREATGSAAKASAAGTAICAISTANSSILKTFLDKQIIELHVRFNNIITKPLDKQLKEEEDENQSCKICILSLIHI